MGVKRKIAKKGRSEVTVSEAFAKFATEKRTLGREDKTITNYKQSLDRLLQVMGWKDPKLIEMDEGVIFELIETLQGQGVRTETINHYLRDLRSFLNWCNGEGYCDKVRVRLIKGQEPIKETYTEDELRALLKKPHGDNYREWRTWAIINWILSTGNREKTVCNIQMKDINFSEKEIVLRQTKGKKVQIIPMSTELYFVLKRFVRDFRSDAGEEDYLFCNVAGEQLGESGLQTAVRYYNTSRGVTRTSVHALRHTFSKHYVKNGGNAFRLQKMLGHSTLEMTRRYVNMFSTDLSEGFDEVSPLDRFVRKQGVRHTVKKKVART